MYCMNCGEKNGDHASFCIKCGQQLSDSITVEKKPNSARKKSKKRSMVLSSLVVVVAIVVVTIFNLWPKGGQAASNDGGITFENFSLNEIVEQCPNCQAAIETYIASITACQDWTTSKEEINALENQKCAQMQHLCTAQSIHVEDVPYAYHGSYGLYTGDWIGAGPAGKGTYTGTIYGSNIVTYTGDWGFGMPNGAGELYLENYFGDWDMTYTGQMKNGMRDGTGSWFEYYDDGYHENTFRIYDEAVYRQNQLTDWTDCVEYKADTGEIYKYCKMKTNELGVPLQGEVWNPGDLSPEQEEALGIATAVGILGFTACLSYSALTAGDSYDSDAGNQRMLAEVNSWRERKAKEEQERAEEAEKKKERNKDIAWGEMKRLEAQGDYNSLDHQSYEIISNTGIWY